MPIFASEPATTVRRRSPWLLSKPVYGAIFLAVALAAGGWQYSRSRAAHVELGAKATAVVCIHDPTFPFEKVQQEILAQAKNEIRERLHIDGQQAGQNTVVTISLDHLPAESVVPLVNVVASAYAQACRAQWRLHVEQIYSAAHEQLRQAQARAGAAQTRFEALRNRQLAAMSQPAIAQPPQIDRPSRAELSHRLDALQERERILLRDRTPLHPSVQEIEAQIAEVRLRMESTPSKRPEPPAATTWNLADAKELKAAAQTADLCKEELQQAQAAERDAAAARGKEPHVDLAAADPLPTSSEGTRAVAIFSNALLTATTSILGVGMVCFGASMEPALASVAELQAYLPVPVVGVIPAAHPGRRSSKLAQRRRFARWGAMAAGLVMLLAFAWLFFH